MANPKPKPKTVLQRDASTVAECRAEVDVLARAGHTVICPCCEQDVAVYKRPLYGSMVKAMLRMCVSAEEEGAWVRMKDTRGGDYAKLRFWGLVESKGKNSGIWRITPYGMRFLRSEISVPRHVFIYKGELIPLPVKKFVTMNEAIHKVFSLAEAMNWATQ